MGFSSVVVAIDFSEVSQAALAFARSLVVPGGNVRVVNVARVGASSGELEETYARLQHFLADAPTGDVRTSIEVDARAGRPAEEILKACAEERAGAIVLGAHSRGALARWLLGSVAEEVARRARVPAIIVRGPHEKLQRVLLAVDFSEPSVEAIRAGAGLADRLGAALEAIHVHGPREPGARDALKEGVASLVTLAIGRAVPVQVVEAGRAADALAAATRPGDLIVCGTHGRGAVGQVLFGRSVATEVVRGAPGPVAIVSPEP